MLEATHSLCLDLILTFEWYCFSNENYLEIILTLEYPYMPQKIHIQQDVGDDDEMYHIK